MIVYINQSEAKPHKFLSRSKAWPRYEAGTLEQDGITENLVVFFITEIIGSSPIMTKKQPKTNHYSLLTTYYSLIPNLHISNIRLNIAWAFYFIFITLSIWVLSYKVNISKAIDILIHYRCCLTTIRCRCNSIF